MAQDFGDDMGNALLNFVTRQAENYLRFGRGRERAFDWWQRHYKKEGNTPEAAKAMAEKQSSREQVVVPFGTSEEAAYYAQVCRENGTYAAAYTDKQGNGFLAFAKEDAKTVAGYAYDTPLIAGIKPDGTGNYGEREVETNMVLSVYSRQNFIRYFALLRDMDAFVFVSGRKIEALEDLSGLPLAENCSGLDIDRILQRPKCLG